jgi:hypothetical protein
MSGKCRAGVSSALRVIEAKAIARPGQRPSYRCAANQRDELAALHIRPSSVGQVSRSGHLILGALRAWAPQCQDARLLRCSVEASQWPGKRGSPHTVNRLSRRLT